MTKMDMIWVVTAQSIHPSISPSKTITRKSIEKKIKEIFKTNITPVMLEKHLVSWVDRQADMSNPARGGSRNRYLFKTIDGLSPDDKGEFRLYMNKDSRFDGLDKNGKTHPDPNAIPEEYVFLIDWYKVNYFTQKI